MKAFINRFSLILIFGLTALVSKAQIVTIDKIKYEINEETSTATVTGCDKAITKAEIKSSVAFNGKDYTVITIGGEAFRVCTDLIEMTIPNSVTSIGRYAFAECTSLTEVTIPNSVTSIGEDAFAACTSLTEVTIPNSVTSIGDGAFSWCTSLKEVTIPNSVTSIGDNAFNRCSGLTDVYYDAENPIGGNYNIFYKAYENATLYVPEKAIERCKAIDPWKNFKNIVAHEFPKVLAESITISNDTIELKVGETATLTATVIPDNTTDKTVAWSSSKESIATIDAVGMITAISVGEAVIIAKCGDVTAECKVIVNPVTADTVTIDMIKYEINEETSTATVIGYIEGITTATIQSSVAYNGKNYSVTSIDIRAFFECYSLTEATIPNSITEIGKYAFYNCRSLMEITIPNSVTKIGDSVFWGCTSLTKVTIPNSVTEISDFTFQDCIDLTVVEIPKSVTSIGNSAFYNCRSLREVTIPNSVTKIGGAAF
ncbi:MAG: leucine-rich repeat protein, partial [Paramuribaculum sp.]|nr:leucine-rich repeat protein [Paramuribaculum sp.]